MAPNWGGASDKKAKKIRPFDPHKRGHLHAPPPPPPNTPQKAGPLANVVASRLLPATQGGGFAGAL